MSANRIRMTLRLAHAAATDKVNGTAASPKRSGPWDEAAWDEACAAFDRLLGHPTPEHLAELYATEAGHGR